MLNLFLVASGGATGALSRYLLSNFLKIYFSQSFYSTLFVNVIGSFLIGYLISLGEYKNLSNNFIRYFLIIGVLGSFTTFSAFSYEVVNLYFSRKLFLALSYVLVSCMCCFAAAFIGMQFNKF